MPVLQEGTSLTRLHEALRWLGRLQRAVEVLLPEWQEDGASQYLEPIHLYLGGVHCSLTHFLLHTPHRDSSLLQEDAPDAAEGGRPIEFLSEEEELSLKTESESARRIRDWLFLRHYEQFLVVLGHHLKSLARSYQQAKNNEA